MKKKKIKNMALNVFTVCMGALAFTSAMTFRNVTREAVAIYIGSLLWLFVAAIEAEKKEGAAE